MIIMSKKIFLIIFLVLFCAIVCEAKVKDKDRELYSQVELFSDAITIIESEYVEEKPPKDLIYGALEGMLGGLDDYSQFMDPESYNEIKVETKGEFGGIGIEIGIRDKMLTIIAPMDGTPAEKVGLKAGDKIIKVEGKSTKDMKLSGAVKVLRGKPGTKVEITVSREDEEKPLDFTIVRSIIKLKSIKSAKILENGVGYVKLVEFQEKTPQDLRNHIFRLKKKAMKAFILDVRNNPGGLLDTAYEVSEIFLPKGAVVVSLKGRSSRQSKVYKSRGNKSFTDFPMVVMVNKGSASASEIVAGAIQDNKRGAIVGTSTFGKGSVQTVIPLRDGSAVKLTTASYYTPSGNSIHEKGITPDVEVELKDEKETPDSQLRAAIDFLLRKDRG